MNLHNELLLSISYFVLCFLTIFSTSEINPGPLVRDSHFNFGTVLKDTGFDSTDPDVLRQSLRPHITPWFGSKIPVFCNTFDRFYGTSHIMDLCYTIEVGYGGLVMAESPEPKQLQPMRIAPTIQ